MLVLDSLFPRLVVLLTALLAFALAAQAADAAKAKSGTLRIAVPAAGQTDVALATVKKGASLRVVKAPAGVAVSGGVSPTGSLAVAVTGKAGKKGKVVIAVRGAKPKGVRILKNAAGVPCDAAGLLGRSLRGGGASALAQRIKGAACKAPKLGTPGGTVKAATSSTLSRGGSLGGGTAKPSTGGSTTKPGGGGTPDPGPAAACDNGIDDDGDGQTDGRAPGNTNPDPGCAGIDDASETGEVAVSEDCKKSSGVFGGANGTSSAAAAINDPCPTVEQAWMTIRPGVATCLASSAASNYGCGPENGLLHVTRQFGLADNRIDFFTINLVGPVDCSATPTIAIESPDGTMHELVEPWPPSCGDDGTTDPPAPLCSNGIDDDNDGQTDAPNAPNAVDPDPGCTTANDQTENSEIPVTAGCDVIVGRLGADSRNTAFAAENCGELTGAWFSPSRTPTGCELRVDFGDPVACGVIGSTASAGFDPTEAPISMYAPIAMAPNCNAPLTVALRRSDGAIMETRVVWAAPEEC